MFDAKKFKTPDAVHAPGYFWLWNGPLRREKLFAQLEDMAAHGVGKVCIHPMPPEFRASHMTAMSPGYLTRDFFEIYRDAVKKCEELGMCCFLYDEGGWPSGGACGRVFNSGPEKFRRHFLELSPDGAVVRTPAPVSATDANMPDNLIPEATEKFLDMTHRSYRRYAGEFFGGTIRFAFTDEPQLGCCPAGKLPWTPGIEEEFLKRKRYDIRPLYREILSNPGATPLETALHRLDYYDVYSQLFAERYLLPLRECCRRFGILSAGHFSGEDEWFSGGLLSYGSIMRSLRALDVPGVDAIWRQLFPGVRLHPFPKLASSAAAQIGGKYVLAEVFSVYGNGLTPEEMRYVVDYLAVCGVNLFVFSGYPYDTSGGNMEGCRPHTGRVDPLWEFMPAILRRAGRLAEISAGSGPAVSTAVFFDQRALWLGDRIGEYSAVNQLALADRMLNSRRDFDYIDDDVIAGGRAVDGKLVFGEASYDRIVFPPEPRLSREAAANLEKLRGSGVPVLTADDFETIPPTLDVAVPTDKLRVRKMVSDGDTVYLVMNISATETTADFIAGEKFAPVLCDPDDGTIRRIPGAAPGRWRHTFVPGASAIFLLSAEPAAVLPPSPRPGRTVLEIPDRWEIAPLRRIAVGDSDYEVAETPPVFQAAEPGDWRGLLGDDFSGKALYRTEFVWNGGPGNYFLDLGRVNYAVRVRLNGTELGEAVFPPYVLPLGRALKPGRNTLEAEVANTLANAIVPESVLKKWTEELPCRTWYELLLRDLERESLPSGLFGPVRIVSERQ